MWLMYTNHHRGGKYVLKNEYIRLCIQYECTYVSNPMLGKWAFFLLFIVFNQHFSQCLEVFGSVTVYIFGWEVWKSSTTKRKKKLIAKNYIHTAVTNTAVCFARNFQSVNILCLVRWHTRWEITNNLSKITTDAIICCSVLFLGEFALVL